MRVSGVCVLGTIVNDSVVLPHALRLANALRRANALRLASVVDPARATSPRADDARVVSIADQECSGDIESKLGRPCRSGFKGPTRTRVSQLNCKSNVGGLPGPLILT